MKLGEILIAEGQLTQEGLEEALDWQVLYGGRLGTNLLELELVEEEHLARALGKQLGVEVAWGELTAEPEMLGLVPRHIADRNELVPWKMEKRRLKVLSTEANKLALIDELAARSGKACQIVVAPEFRMNQLLRKHYQATRQMRALDFGVVPVERESLRRKKEKAARGNVEQAPELIDEGAFAAIYAQVLEGRSPGGAAGKSAVDALDMAAAVAGSVESLERTSDLEAVPPQLLQQKPPPPVAPRPPAPKPAKAAPPRPPPPPPVKVAPPRPPPPQRTPTLMDARPVAKPAAAAKPMAQRPAQRPVAPKPPPVEQLPDDAIVGDAEILEVSSIERSAEAEQVHDTPVDLPRVAPRAPAPALDATVETAADWMHHPAAPSSAWDEVPPAPAAHADEPPLQFKQAVAALAGVTDRDAIARIVLRTARSLARRALLLQVQGHVALGWDGLGEGLDGGAARAVAVPLGPPSAFQLVVRSRSHFLGPLQKTQTNIRFLAQLGKKVPLSSLILPILHKERVSHLLYLDNGHKQHAPSEIGEMLILGQRIAQTVEALVLRKRQAARG